MSRRKRTKRASKTGRAPGLLMHVGEKKVERPHLRLIEYDSENLKETELEHVEEAFVCRDTPPVSWINVDGLHEVGIIEKLGQHFNIHPLVLEDILNTGQRSKLEDYGDYIFIVLRMLSRESEEVDVEDEQICLILGANYVISFQERHGDVFDPLRRRIRDARGRIRNQGPDYLTYALMDTIVDNYFLILESIGEKAETLEQQLLEDPQPAALQETYLLKNRIIELRKAVWPLRDVVGSLQRGESPLIGNDTPLFLRDLYDHTIRVIETIESQRDLTSGLVDLYLSTASYRMNEVMKVLTIIATTFIPLTFVAGIYGMNFDDMPGIHSLWGFPVMLVAMAAVFVAMLFYFKRKDWL